MTNESDNKEVLSQEEIEQIVNELRRSQGEDGIANILVGLRRALKDSSEVYDPKMFVLDKEIPEKDYWRIYDRLLAQTKLIPNKGFPFDKEPIEIPDKK